MNVHGSNDVGQEEIRAAETLVPEPSAFEMEMFIERLKRHKSLRIDQIKSQKNLLKQVIGKFSQRSINLLILFGIRRNGLRSGRS